MTQSPLTRARLWCLWLLACGLLLAGIFTFEVNRSQEGWVVETSRTMLDAPLHRWMVPLCNGQVRMKKPPLAYWITAGAYRVLGISEYAARIPAVLCSAFVLALVYRLGRDLFNQRAGLLAAGILLGTFLFFRFARYAETDTYALCFIALAVWALHAAAAERSFSGRRLLLHHVAGMAMGLCIMVKGLQAAFPLLFLLAQCLSRRSLAPARGFLFSGAMLTALALAAPWFIYVLRAPESAWIGFELKTIATGRNHGRPVWEYLLVFFEATAPWVGLIVLALAAAIPRFKRDEPLRLLILFGSMMFIALSATPQKQDHYFLPMLIPLALTTGWMLDRALGEEDPKLTRAARWILGITLTVLVLGAPALPLAAHFERQSVRGYDIALAGALAAAGAAGLWLLRRRGLGAGLNAALPAVALALAVLLGPWQESLEPVRARDVARALQDRYGDRELAFLGAESLPVVYYMRRPIPRYERLADIPATCNGREVLILSGIRGTSTPPAQEIERFVMRNGTLGVFRRGDKQAPAAGAVLDTQDDNQLSKTLLIRLR